MNPKIAIINDKRHPLFESIIHIPQCIIFNLDEIDHWEFSHSIESVFDFSCTNTQKKEIIIERCVNADINQIFIEANLCWGEFLMTKYPQVKGAFGLCFSMRNKSYEYFLHDEKYLSIITEFFDHFQLTGHPGTSAAPGMTFARVLSQIINEAYYSIEDQIATKQDIDQAMKFGVNYPLGPFEWSKLIGPKLIVTLLKELQSMTSNPRYTPAPKLILESTQSSGELL